MISRRLITAFLISLLLHATGLFLAVVLNSRPSELSLTAKRGKIQAVVVPTHSPIQRKSAPIKAPRHQESIADMNVTSVQGDRNTPPESANTDVFLPQENLTRQPRPESPVALEDIPQPDETGVFQMRIWINQRGETVHIETDETTAPARFVEQVAQRFKTTRFVPGERDGAPVASIIRIEISY